MRRSRPLAFALAAMLVAACGDSRSSGGPDPSPAALASFVARGSVEQAYVLGAEPGQELRLVAADGSRIASGEADPVGALLFRDVPPGSGYVVSSGEGAAEEESPPFRVATPDDVPPPDFYESQRLEPGYGYLETRDGTLLAVNVILPGPPEEGPYPTVVEYSGYDPANPDSPQPSTLIASALGYAAVGVNMRGTGCSGGAFQFFETLQSTDGYDAIEVIAAQPWVLGHRVGMVGLSYPGISQLFVAQMRPPSLAAIAPLSVIADTVRGTLFPGGIFNDGFALEWARDRQRDALPGGQPWSQKRMDEGDQTCIDNQQLRGQTPDILQMIDENRFYVPETADPLTPALFVDRIQVPVFLAGAWQDEQVGAYFATMLDEFRASPSRHFTVTNGSHVDPLGPAIFSRWMEFLSFYVRREIPDSDPIASVVMGVLRDSIFQTDDPLTLEEPRFGAAPSFERALARFEAEPPVRVLFDNGAGGAPGAPVPGFEASFASWPPPATTPTAWYLEEGGRLSPEPPTAAGADRYRYDPSQAQTTSLSGGTEASWVAQPDWHWEQPHEGAFAAYATEPLDEDLVLLGSASADLWIEATAADVDLQVTISELTPGGDEIYVQSGWLRASQRRIDPVASTELRPFQLHLEADAEPLPAGEPALVRVEIFPFGHVFRAGSRIRAVVAAPGRDRSHWRFEALRADREVFVSIERSPARPSRLVLPVVDGLEVPTPRPPCGVLRGQPCRPYLEAPARGGSVP